MHIPNILIPFALFKKFFVAILTIQACLSCLFFSLTLINVPKKSIDNLNYKPLTESIQATPTLSTDTLGFNYKIIGFRSGKSNTSVILETNNIQKTLKQGDILDGKYKLLKVNAQDIFVEHNGKIFQITNHLGASK